MASKDLQSKRSCENHWSDLVWLISSSGENCALQSGHFKKERGPIPALASKSSMVGGHTVKDPTTRSFCLKLGYSLL